MKRRIILPSLFLAAGIVFAIVIIKPYKNSQSLQAETFPTDAYLTNAEEVSPPEESQPSRAEQAMRALAAAYPQRIERIEFRNDDWAVFLSGKWYYYSEGRLLPKELLDKASEYSPTFTTYNYQRELPPWTEPTAEQAERFRNRNNVSNESMPRPRLQRSLAFQEALWQASNHSEASQRVKSVKFLGNAVTVHSDIVEILAQVEERIIAAAKNEPQVQSWITNIGEMHGWNWRNVAGSQSRSNHSYGIAIDILPKSLGGKQTYWQWASQSGREWWNIPYEDRYHPPDTVIKTFEAYGFIWGGKWAIFDTMHFEYRPEIFILNGMGLATMN